jgi:2C-methyl-D-erythritol 2,4-cyclodiphosphate synthase
MKEKKIVKTAKQIANEAWYMLPNDCKIIMQDFKKSYIESLEADISDAIKSACNNVKITTTDDTE